MLSWNRNKKSERDKKKERSVFKIDTIYNIYYKRHKNERPSQLLCENNFVKKFSKETNYDLFDLSEKSTSLRIKLNNNEMKNGNGKIGSKIPNPFSFSKAMISE